MNESELQEKNKLWWSRHPMNYDWHGTLPFPEGTSAFFDEIDRRFFAALPLAHQNRFFKDLLPMGSLKGKRVLEVGCGLGMHAQRLCEAGASLSAIDLTLPAVELTRKRLNLHGLTAEVQQMDTEQLAFSDGTFDFVWSWGVLHHTADPHQALKEIFRVLKPGGEFRMMVYHRHSLMVCLNILRGFLSGKLRHGRSVDEILNLYSDGCTARYYGQDECAALLRERGFRVKKTLVLGQKSELVPLPGKGMGGGLKTLLVSGFPDALSARVLSRVGSFLFTVSEKPTAQVPALKKPSGPLEVVLLGGREGDGWISISRYQRELLQGVRGLPEAKDLRITAINPLPGGLMNPRFRINPLNSSLASYGTRFLLYPWQIPRIPGAIYHILNQSLSHLLFCLDPARTIITCHDLLHFPLWDRRRKFSRWPWATDRLYRFCVGGLPRCAAVIAVSQKNKEDAVRYLGCYPGRISVIHQGVSSSFWSPADPRQVAQLRERWKLPREPILLHVGIPTYYKNVEGVLKAVAELRHRFHRRVTLLRVGPKLGPDQRRLIRRLRIAEAVLEVGTQGDDVLPAAYRLADCFVFPSLYEGFGFPPLEAMACGLPVVVSNRGSLPEIAGDAALQADPEEPQEIARAVLRILTDPALKETLRQRGLLQAQRFRWEDCARQTLAVYRQVATLR